MKLIILQCKNYWKIRKKYHKKQKRKEIVTLLMNYLQYIYIYIYSLIEIILSNLDKRIIDPLKGMIKLWQFQFQPMVKANNPTTASSKRTNNQIPLSFIHIANKLKEYDSQLEFNHQSQQIVNRNKREGNSEPMILAKILDIIQPILSISYYFQIYGD